jgi:recombination protein RecT
MTTQALRNVATGGQPQRSLAEMKPKDQIAYFLDQKKNEIAKMLPKHLNAERLLKVAQIAATTTPALLKCDVPSLVGAIGQCAQMGLEPNTVLGHAYLVPFNTKRKDANGVERWVNSVQVIIGYKGLIDLARRSGQIVSIAAHDVCEKDKFELVYGLDEKLNHTPAMGERGEIVGFYAVAKLKDGGHCCEFMSVHQVQEIMRGTQSKGNYGPWKDHFSEMGRKTVIRRLAKYLPLSIEFQTAAALDGMAEAGKDQGLDTIDGDFNMLPEDAPQIENSGVIDQATGEITTDNPEGQAGTPAGPESETSSPAAAGAVTDGDDTLTFAQVADSINKATDLDVLDVAADLITLVPDEGQQKELSAMYQQRREQLSKPTPRTRQARSNLNLE